MDNKFYVSYEAAKLLKEKGYNEECECAIDEDGDIYTCEYRMNQDLPEWKWSCPTKSEAINWLEGKGLVIVLSPATILQKDGTNIIVWRFYVVRGTEGWYNNYGDYKTRLEAEDNAIIKACELLTSEN